MTETEDTQIDTIQSNAIATYAICVPLPATVDGAHAQNTAPPSIGSISQTLRSGTHD